MSKNEKLNYTYILRCSDGTYYTGWTNDLDNRIKCHNSKKGAKYTKTRTPVELVYYETFATKGFIAQLFLVTVFSPVFVFILIGLFCPFKTSIFWSVVKL